VKEELTSFSVDWISLENDEDATWLTIQATEEGLEGTQKVYKVEFYVFGQLLGSQSFTLNFVRPYLLPNFEDYTIEYFRSFATYVRHLFFSVFQFFLRVLLAWAAHLPGLLGGR